MKNYRILAPIVLIVLMVASWYMLVSASIQTNSEYENYLAEARKYAEMGVTKYAIDNYNKALEIKQSADVYVEVADYYKKEEKDRERLSWCQNFSKTYPTEGKAYEYLLEVYYDQKAYASCFDTIYAADKRNVRSEYIETISSEIAYLYKLDFNTYDDVGVYSNNFCPIKSKDAWGFVDRYGELRITCRYISIGAYTKSNFASVVNAEGDAYFIDKAGSKVLVATDKYKSFGLLVDGIIVAQKDDNSYTYVDQDFNVLFGSYDYASTMNNSIAAVKAGDQWSIINSKGEAVSDEKYSDVVIDEKQIAYRNERLFVKSADKYIMINSSGKQIGSLNFEDAKLFNDDSYAAVKIDGRWCFIDKSGNLRSDKQYEDARSYSNGLAAVKISGKWGYIDENEDLKIPTEFFEAKDFNEKGSCFVKTGDKWQLLKLYRLNREG